MTARTDQLEENADFNEALIIKQSHQVIGKDKLIKELQGQINDFVETVQALERGQANLLKRCNALEAENARLKL